MEFYSQSIKERFLKIGCRPYVECWCGLSLKTGVIVIASLDMILMVLGLTSLIMMIVLLISGGDYVSPLLEIGVDLLHIGIGISAIFGVQGLSQLKNNWLFQYTLVKIGVIPIKAAFTVIYARIDPRNELDDQVLLIYYFVTATGILILELVLAKYVWSAYVRIKHNEAAVVLHGLQSVTLMHSQANNLTIHHDFQDFHDKEEDL